MTTSNEKEIADLLEKKRSALFCAAFCAMGLLTGWLYSTEIWLLLLVGVVLWIFSSDGLLWLARHPGSSHADYYRQRFWWMRAFDWEFHFGRTKVAEKEGEK